MNYIKKQKSSSHSKLDWLEQLKLLERGSPKNKKTLVYMYTNESLVISVIYTY